MPNLILSNACNLSCSFCFASEYRAEPGCGEHARMSLDEYAGLLEFDGTDTVRLCGGEPTLHPDFIAMLELALQPEGRGVFLMTNGIWPEAVRQRIRGLGRRQARRIQYLVNVLPPAQYREGQAAQLDDTLRLLRGTAITLGVTLDDPDFDPGWLFALADRHGYQQLRFSVAAPTVTEPRSWVDDPEQQLRALARAVHRLVVRARQRGLMVQSDCGYVPPCMFEPEALAELQSLQGSELDLAFRCDGPVDIGPGGEAWRCYGLYSTVRTRTEGFDHAGELAEHFDRQIEVMQKRLLFQACADCDHRRDGTCGGGCHATRSVLQLQRRARQAGVRLDDEGLRLAVPAVNPERLRQTQLGGESCWMLREFEVWTRQDLSVDERAVLERCDGLHAVGEILAELELHPLAVANALRLLRQLYEQRGIELSAPGGRSQPRPRWSRASRTC